MKWDRRKNTNEPKTLPIDLPVDFLKLVTETVTQALEKGLIEVRKTHPAAKFYADGSIFADEVLLAITLSQGDQDLFATTVYASADYNPSAEKPSIQDVLDTCLDAAGAVYDLFLDLKNPEKVAELMDPSLGAMEDAPFEWTPLDLSKDMQIPVYVKIDKSNPQLDAAADKWLQENDPEYEKISGIPSAAPKDAEEFLEERLDAIKGAKSGSGNGPGSSGFGGGGSGPITH